MRVHEREGRNGRFEFVASRACARRIHWRVDCSFPQGWEIKSKGTYGTRTAIPQVADAMDCPASPNTSSKKNREGRQDFFLLFTNEGCRNPCGQTVVSFLYVQPRTSGFPPTGDIRSASKTLTRTQKLQHPSPYKYRPATRGYT